jgi:hypothetical protein
MAGSFSHIVTKRGRFNMRLIENMGDAHEALEECFNIIALLVDGDFKKLKNACNKCNYPIPDAAPVFVKRAWNDYGGFDEEDEEGKAS